MSRSPRPRHPGRAALGAAVGVLAAAAPVSAAPSAAADPGRVQRCHTRAITWEEAEQGVVPEITCTWVVPGSRLATPRSSVVLAVHYDGVGRTGDSLVVSGTTCSNVGLPTMGTWNDRVSSTEFVSCGNVKHFTGSSYTGTNQLVSGTSGQYANLNSTLNNDTSSIQYG